MNKNNKMIVKSKREVDIGILLVNLDIKSRVQHPGQAGYDVTVPKLLLRDAHDVIRTLIEQAGVKEVWVDTDVEIEEDEI